MFIDLNCFLRWAMWPMGLLFISRISPWCSEVTEADSLILILLVKGKLKLQTHLSSTSVKTERLDFMYIVKRTKIMKERDREKIEVFLTHTVHLQILSSSFEMKVYVTFQKHFTSHACRTTEYLWDIICFMIQGCWRQKHRASGEDNYDQVYSLHPLYQVWK